MKFIIINTDYTEFVENTYKKYPDLINKNYQNQLKHRYDTLFGTADFYSKNLIKLGHKAIDIFPNNSYMQKQWAEENNIKYKNNYLLEKFPKLYRIIKPNWYYKILKAQIDYFNPDIIYNLGMKSVTHSFFKRIKSENKNIKIIGQHASPITRSMKNLQSYNLILSSLPNQVAYFKKKGVDSQYFQLGFEKSILKKVKGETPGYNVVHIGGYGRVHLTRNKLLEEVAKKINIKFWGFATKNLPEDSLILKNFQGEAWGIKMYNILYNSKITTTMHIKAVADKYANNMSLYESTGMGALLITDYKENLHEIFEIGKEVETYNNPDELAQKIKYYLNHDDERKKIARAGQKRTLKDHTWEKRMSELIDIINKKFVKKNS